MKKIIFIAVFAIACTTASQAQFGVKAGLNMANWGGEDGDFEGKKGLLGFYGGVFYNIKASSNFSIQPELVYSGQGVKIEESGVEGKILLGYINLTPLARYNTSSGFFVGVGPQIGFLMSAKAKAEGESEDIKESFKGIDFAAAIALGYEMENGFGFYARYNHGLSSIADEDDVKISNRVFQIGLRYKLSGMKGK